MSSAFDALVELTAGAARHAARKTPLSTLDRAGTRGIVLLDEAGADLVRSVRRAADVDSESLRKLTPFEYIFAAVLAKLPGLEDALLRGGRVLDLTGISPIFAQLSRRDWSHAFGKALEMVLEKEVKSAGRMHNIQGALREAVVKHLPETRSVFDTMARDLAGVVRASRGRTSLLDSSIYREVELSPRPGSRTLLPATDRVGGLLTIDPVPLPAPVKSTTREYHWADGAVDLRVLNEVKGARTAPKAVRQFLNASGRAQEGYVVIGGRCYVLKYEPEKTLHLLVAPEGEKLDAARRQLARLAEQGVPTHAIGYAEALEQQIVTVSNVIHDAGVDYFRASHPFTSRSGRKWLGPAKTGGSP